MRKRLSTSSWKNKYDIQNRSVLNKVGTSITCWTQIGIQAKSFESLTRCPQGYRCLVLKEKRPLNSVGVLSITGGGWDSDHCLKRGEINDLFDLKNSGIRKYIHRMCGYISCTHRLNHQLHAQCFTDAGNSVETRLRIGPERLI